MNREDFNLVDKLVYFDSSATSLKPKILSESLSNYYNNYSANIHRADYKISLKASDLYEESRRVVSEFINANTNEVIYTSGTTDSLNKIIFGFFRNILKENDEVILSKAEHASNIIPWYELKKDINIKIKFVELDNNKVTLENIKKIVTNNTKVISLAHVTNVLGDIRQIKEICEYAKLNNIYVNVDGAQAIGHIKVDVKDLGCDFYSFSAHKVLGPTGLGIMYGKYELLEKTTPIITGGGMNATYNLETYEMDDIPKRFEAGTPNIASAIAFMDVIKYINNIGLLNIIEYMDKLKDYAYSKLKEVDNIIIYNKPDTPIFAINIKDIFAQDLSIYLDKYNICTRAGNHCAKVLKEEINVKNTVRISLHFYNTFEEVDYLVKVLNNKNIKNEII